VPPAAALTEAWVLLSAASASFTGLGLAAAGSIGGRLAPPLARCAAPFIMSSRYVSRYVVDGSKARWGRN